MPYEFDKTFTISQKMIDAATANGSLFVDASNNLMMNKIKDFLGSRLVETLAHGVTVKVKTLPFDSAGWPLSPEPSVEKVFYIPIAVTTWVDKMLRARSLAEHNNVPFVPTCEPCRFSIRWRMLPAPIK